MGYEKQQWEGNEWLGAVCDNCGERWEHWNEGWTLMPDELALWPELDDSGWIKSDYVEGLEPGKLYCKDCHEFDDEDNFILKPKTDTNEI